MKVNPDIVKLLSLPSRGYPLRRQRILIRSEDRL
jgi:hypothetical protein